MSDNFHDQQLSRTEAALEGREGTVYHLSAVERWTQSQIGEHLGLSQQRVSQILADAREKIEPPDLLAMRERSLRLHEDVIKRAYEMAKMNGAPVTAGKDGRVVTDPEDQSVVRDYALRIQALKLAADADRNISKLLGLDAASKTEVTGTVKFEIVGVEPGDLT